MDCSDEDDMDEVDMSLPERYFARREETEKMSQLRAGE
jgi:hypothetical protein